MGASPDQPEKPGTPAMRVSDAERSATAQRLKVALDEGRLSLVEYDDRLQQAYAAVVRADLEPLTADLPRIRDADLPAAREAQQVEERAEKRAAWLGEWRSWAGTSVLLIGIWGIISLAAGEATFFWPMFPVGIWALVLVSSMFERDDPTSSREESE